MRAILHYFIASLAVVSALGFAYYRIGKFVSRRADKMGRGHAKGKEIICRKQS